MPASSVPLWVSVTASCHQTMRQRPQAARSTHSTHADSSCNLAATNPKQVGHISCVLGGTPHALHRLQVSSDASLYFHFGAHQLRGAPACVWSGWWRHMPCRRGREPRPGLVQQMMRCSSPRGRVPGVRKPTALALRVWLFRHPAMLRIGGHASLWPPPVGVAGCRGQLHMPVNLRSPV